MYVKVKIDSLLALLQGCSSAYLRKKQFNFFLTSTVLQRRKLVLFSPGWCKTRGVCIFQSYVGAVGSNLLKSHNTSLHSAAGSILWLRYLMTSYIWNYWNNFIGIVSCVYKSCQHDYTPIVCTEVVPRVIYWWGGGRRPKTARIGFGTTTGKKIWRTSAR